MNETPFDRDHLHSARLGTRIGRTLILLALTALAGNALSPPVAAGTIRHDRADSLYTSLAASYPSVGRLTWGSSLCTGTLIREDWVLSAGHCLDAAGFSASDWTFNLSDSGGGIHVGAERFVHPDWTSSGGDLSSGADIALLRLSTVETDVVRTKINISDTSEVGRTGTHVGYGRTGTGVTGDTLPAGTKRAGDNLVDVDGDAVTGYQDNVLFTDFDSGSSGDNVIGSATPLNLEYMIAPGDSGGSMFMDLGDGEVIAGVHSFIASVDGSTDASYGDLSGSVRVSSYSNWILSTMEAVDPVAPELASWLTWALLIGGVAIWRRRLAGQS